MKTIIPFQLLTSLTAQPSLPVIDVRTPVEFAEVHVPQARSVPLDELKPSSLQLQKDQPVYLLCRSGQRAAKAAEKLVKEGFLQPVVVEGGTLAWIDAGLPVTRSAVKAISLERTGAHHRRCELYLWECCWGSSWMPVSSGFRVLSARVWCSPASRTFVAWDFYLQKCLGINAPKIFEANVNYATQCMQKEFLGKSGRGFSLRVLRAGKPRLAEGYGGLVSPVAGSSERAGVISVGLTSSK